MLYSLHRLYLADEGFQLGGVVYHHRKHARKESVVRVDADGAEQDVVFLVDDRRDVGHDADIIMPYDAERDGVLLALAFASPTGTHDAVGEACFQFGCVRAVRAVYLDASRYGNETEYVIAIDGVAAPCKLEVDTLQVLVDDQYIVLVKALFFLCRLHVEALGTAVSHFLALFTLVALHLYVSVYQGVHIRALIGDALIEVGHGLEARFLDEAHQDGFVVFYLAVFELAL